MFRECSDASARITRHWTRSDKAAASAQTALGRKNLANIGATVPIAVALGLKLVTFHAGFVPHDPADPDYAKMLSRLSTVSEIFKKAGIAVGLETGQETAEELASLLKALNDSNVCINFDPANMLLYGKGDPIQALRLLAPWIRQVHIKDAVTSRIPGAWGERCPSAQAK